MTRHWKGPTFCELYPSGACPDSHSEHWRKNKNKKNLVLFTGEGETAIQIYQSILLFLIRLPSAEINQYNQLGVTNLSGLGEENIQLQLALNFYLENRMSAPFSLPRRREMHDSSPLLSLVSTRERILTSLCEVRSPEPQAH